MKRALVRTQVAKYILGTISSKQYAQELFHVQKNFERAAEEDDNQRRLLERRLKNLKKFADEHKR